MRDAYSARMTIGRTTRAPNPLSGFPDRGPRPQGSWSADHPSNSAQATVAGSRDQTAIASPGTSPPTVCDKPATSLAYPLRPVTRSLAILALTTVLACSGSSTSSSTDGGAPACTGQQCGSGCCEGTYCWAFSNICVQTGTCLGAGVDTPMPDLCSCDGYPASPCPLGQTCPRAAHGHATYCMP